MKRKEIYFSYMVLTVLLLLAAVCLLTVSLNSNQAVLASPLPLTFSGEYSFDGETWEPLSDSPELSALQGRVTLRGHLNMEVMEGTCLNYYRNHIGVSLYVNGEVWAMDAITDLASRGIRLMPSMCGREWVSISSAGITPEDTLEIHLYNPHAHGNGTAYRDFLNSLCCGPDPAQFNLMEKILQPYGQPFRLAGALFVMMALILLGAAMASAFLRVRVGGRLLKIGLLILFASGFFIFDTIDLCFWSKLLVLNTYARQLSIMLAVSCLGYCICDGLTGKMGKVGEAAVLISAMLNILLIVLSFTGAAVIYDTYIYWAASQWLLCPLLMLCCIWQLRQPGRKNALFLISGILLCGTILLDIGGVGASILSYGVCSKGMFCLLFAVHLVMAGKSVVGDHQAAIRAQSLEKELEESRISIMLSQLQPHFLFNVLNSIYYLCGTDGETARKVVDKFSTYLRNNLDSLNQKTMIPFSKEFDHIRTYLELEKIRFEEELAVVYDIQTDSFFLPVLTVQPLVENAVKHGVTKKRGGGVVTLATREEPDSFVVTVSDTGVGFDPERFRDDGKTHIGIENVRLRLKNMAGGTLEVTSAPGSGTTAVIRIPKKEDTGE